MVFMHAEKISIVYHTKIETISLKSGNLQY